jgi:hypothetical protein
MKLFRRKAGIDDDKRFEQFFQDVKERSFEIKLKKKDEQGNTISSIECDVIKLSSLNKIIKKNFGYSMKDSKAFTCDYVK